MTVTLDRPHAHNTLTTALLDDLHRALDLAETDQRYRVLVLHGHGGVFCTGMDVDEAAGEDSREAERAAGRFFDLMVRYTTCPLTIIAVVDGRTVGGGVGLAAASDLVIGTSRAQFSLPEALWGLLPCCVLPFLVRRVGFQRAYAMTLSTLPVPARQAAETGLIDELTEDTERVLHRVLARVTRIAPATVHAAKRYAAQLGWVTAGHLRRQAVEEFLRLSAGPEFRHAIDRYVRTGRYPWSAQD